MKNQISHEKKNANGNEFRHFLSYELKIIFGEICGPLDLYYKVTDPKTDGSQEFVILCVDGYRNREDETTFPVDLTLGSRKEQLKPYLQKMCRGYLGFTGQPLYRSSNLFTEQEFMAFVDEAERELEEIGKRAEKMIGSNELLSYFQEKKLFPRSHDKNLKHWTASCPSGRGHPVMISSQSNEWGCGYCRRKGGLAELKAWLAERGRA